MSTDAEIRTTIKAIEEEISRCQGVIFHNQQRIERLANTASRLVLSKNSMIAKQQRQQQEQEQKHEEVAAK